MVCKQFTQMNLGIKQKKSENVNLYTEQIQLKHFDY